MSYQRYDNLLIGINLGELNHPAQVFLSEAESKLGFQSSRQCRDDFGPIFRALFFQDLSPDAVANLPVEQREAGIDSLGDPTTTQGKNPALAKELELKGWGYPKHLAGRAFAVVAHGDAAGPENLRRMLADWLTDIGMIQAGPSAALDTWIGWYRPYATSHEDLDADEDIKCATPR